MKDRSNNDAKAEHVPDAVHSSKYGGFKKKGSNNNSLNTEASNFKGLGLRIGKDGPKVYEKTTAKLSLYNSMQLKNGSDVVVCLRAEEYVETKVSVLP